MLCPMVPYLALIARDFVGSNGANFNLMLNKQLIVEWFYLLWQI
jgi:hypothetical protein